MTTQVDLLPEAQPEVRLTPMLAAITLTRLILNGIRRFPYTILTPMATALNVPRAALEQVLSLQFLIALLSPFAGGIIDRGRKRIMLVMVGLTVIGCTVAALGQSFGAVVVAIMLASIAKTLFDPAMQAYLGDHVPYARRGFAIGVSELAWSGALVTIVALSAFMIGTTGLASIFALLGVLAALAFVLLWVVLPPDRGVGTVARERIAFRESLRAIFANRAALTILLCGFLIAVGFDQFLIIYESWLLDKLKLSTQTIGALSWLFGIAEFGGEMVIVLLADRLGKHRLAMVAPATLGLVFFALRFLAEVNITMALAGLFVLFFVFEISTISLTPLATEAIPAARGVMLTLYVSAISFGRGIGALIGGGLYRAAGAEANLMLAGIFFLTVAALVWVEFRTRRASTEIHPTH